MFCKACLKLSLKKDPKYVFKTNNCLTQVNSIAKCSRLEQSAILLTCTKLQLVSKTFVLSIVKWTLWTGFTVVHKHIQHALIQKVLSEVVQVCLFVFYFNEWRKDPNITISRPSSARQGNAI